MKRYHAPVSLLTNGKGFYSPLAYTLECRRLGTASAAFAQTPADIPPGLVAWWRAENSTQDTLGTNQGTLQGNATCAARKAGQGFTFDRLGDYVKVAKPSRTRQNTPTHIPRPVPNTSAAAGR